jgi:hypothetical protein
MTLWHQNIFAAARTPAERAAVLRDVLNQARVQAGFDYIVYPKPEVPEKKAPTTMNEIKEAAWQDAICKHGSISKAARALGVSRGWHHGRLQLMKQKIVQMAALVLAVICLNGCGTLPGSVGSRISTAALPDDEARTATAAQRTAPAFLFPPPLPVASERATLAQPLVANAATAPKQLYLTWDGSSDAYVVRTGPSRGVYTNSFIVTSNATHYVAGLAYAVSAKAGEQESEQIPYPSNRVDRIWVQTGTNLDAFADAFIWTTATNDPQRFLRLRSELVRWE